MAHGASRLLKSHREDAIDADTLHDFERVLTEEGLPSNVDELVDSTYTEQPPEVSKFHKLEVFLYCIS